MNNNNLSTITDQQTITSMEIAEITGKRHRDVLKAIRTMEPAWEKEQGRKFALLLRETPTGLGGHKMNPYYKLNRKESLYVATKFNDQARARLVIRWAELEEQRLQALQPQPAAEPEHETVSNLPADPSQLTRKQLLLMALEAEEEKEKLQQKVEGLEADNYGLMLDISQRDQEIIQLQERTAYLGVIMADSGTVTASQIAQDYGMAAVSFNNLLKGLRIQRKVGDQWILYSDIINHGYVANRMIPIHHAGGSDTYKPLTVWTQMGRRFLYERLKKHGVLPMIERQQAPTK